MNENLSKYENKESINKKIFDINNNISFFNKNNFVVKFTNIKKEIKKRSNTLKRYFNIKNTIFKEMQSKKNSLIYQELIKYMGKYFFGPNGKVTEKYKLLRDYYEDKEMNIGFNSKIIAGTLDYYSLLSDYDSYSQRINSTKEQLLFSSRNLAVAKSGFDIVDQSALSNNKLFNKKKNFVNLNIRNIKNLYNSNSSINQSNDTFRNNEGKNKPLKKLKIKINSVIKNEKMNDNENLNLYKLNDDILKKNNAELSVSLSIPKSPKKTILERYSNDLKIKKLKQKLKYFNSYNDSQSSSSYNLKEINKTVNILRKRNLENNIRKRIKPIIFLNRNSVMDLSFLKKTEIKSKNERNAKILIRKRNINNILFEKSDLTSLSNIKLPSLENITLSKRKEKLKNGRHFVIE